jgi:peroxidase
LSGPWNRGTPSYFLSNDNINFTIPAGRYDGTISITSEILPNLPPTFAGFDQLVKMFADKGVGTLE